MTPDLNALKLSLQLHFADGLVIVVGSGLSCAEGLPSMGELGKYLIGFIGKDLTPDDQALWAKISPLIARDGVEAALLSNPPSQTLEAAIVDATAEFILKAERKVIQEVFEGNRVLRLSRLMKHLLKPRSGIPIVTTNYDRLIEIACEEAGLGVDALFVGSFAGVLEEHESRMSLLRNVTIHKNKVRYHYREHANVFKPHGSFDWYQREGKPVRYSGDLESPRLIITPGLNKFRSGYESPFDRHREKANRAIDNAARFLIVGYGFNDDHLQTHLTPMIKTGKPTVVLSQSLSPRARALLTSSPSVIGIEYADCLGVPGSRVLKGSDELLFPATSMWDLGNFVSEVLEP